MMKDVLYIKMIYYVQGPRLGGNHAGTNWSVQEHWQRKLNYNTKIIDPSKVELKILYEQAMAI